MRPDRVAVRLAVDPCRTGLGFGLDLDRLGLGLGGDPGLGSGGLGGEADLLRVGLGLADAGRRGRRWRASSGVRLRVGGLAHVDLELLLGLVGLELGDLRLLLDDRLA